jgi:hypothetical protein
MPGAFSSQVENLVAPKNTTKQGFRKVAVSEGRRKPLWGLRRLIFAQGGRRNEISDMQPMIEMKFVMI